MNFIKKYGLSFLLGIILLSTLLIPFNRSLFCNIGYNCEINQDDVARYAAGGQVFGALATLFTLIYVVWDNSKRNKDEEDRKNREIITLWQNNIPQIDLR